MLDEKYFIPLTNDALFKDVLSQKENIEYLEQVLETCLGYEKGFLRGKCEVIAEAMLPKNKLNDKSVRGDILVKTDDCIYDLEMYNYYDSKSKLKSFLYLARLVSNIDKSENYDFLKNIVGLNFVNKKKNNAPAYDEFGFISTITGEKYLDGKDFKIVIYNLDKIDELGYNKDELKKILKYFKAESFDERSKIAKGDKGMEKFNENVNSYTIDEDTKELFAKLQEEVRKENIYYQAKEEGLTEGIEQGEIQKQIELCKNMKNENIPIKTISKVTGLTIEEIEKL